MRQSRIPLLVTAAVLALLYLPLLVVAAQSFNASRFGGSWEGASLQWYRRLLSDRAVWSALGNSLAVASVTAIVASILGTAAGFCLHRWRSSLQRSHLLLIYLPLVMPDVLLGLSLLLLFLGIGLPLGLTTIILAHTTFALSYVAFVVLARLEGFDLSSYEAALDLGATPRQAWFRVLLPQLAPGIAADALLAFTLSLDDFVVTFFVAGPGSTTLPIHVYSMIKHGYPPIINALSTLLLCFTCVVAWVCQRLSRTAFAGEASARISDVAQ